jgi:hypothetical protein
VVKHLHSKWKALSTNSSIGKKYKKQNTKFHNAKQLTKKCKGSMKKYSLILPVNKNMENGNKDQVINQRMNRRGTQDKESHADLPHHHRHFLRVARHVQNLVKCGV